MASLNLMVLLYSNGGELLIESAAVETLIALSDGDARCALNGLELAVNAKLAGDNRSNKSQPITDADIRNGLVRSHVVYDRIGMFSCVIFLC